MAEGKLIPLRPEVPSSPPPAQTQPLVGRRIVGISYNPFKDAKGTTFTRPVIYLDDGSSLHLLPEETQGGRAVRLERVPK